MNLAPLPLLGNQFLLDNSSYTVITACPRQGMYNTSFKRRSSHSKPALHFGKVIHEALEYRDKQPGLVITPAIEQGMIDIIQQGFELGQNADDYRNSSYAIQLIKEYNRKYPVETHPAYVTPDGTPAVEMPFAIPLCDITINQPVLVTDPDLNSGQPTIRHIDKIQIVFTGKIDKVAIYKSNLYVFDHKTSSMGGDYFFEEFETGSQFKGYVYAAQKLLNQPIKGAIINAIFNRKLTKTGKGIEFQRAPINYHPDVIEEWLESFTQTAIDQIQRHLHQSAHPLNPHVAFPMNSPACKTKYGTCQFFQICSLPPSLREQQLRSSLYEDNTWNPLDQDDPKPPTAEVADAPAIFQMFNKR